MLPELEDQSEAWDQSQGVNRLTADSQRFVLQFTVILVKMQVCPRDPSRTEHRDVSQ